MDTTTGAYAATSDHRPHLTEAFAVARGALRHALAAPDDAPTPCTEFTVHDLQAHVLAVTGRIRAMGEGRPAVSAPASIEPADGDWLGAFDDNAAAADVLWAGLDLDSDVLVPWGVIPAHRAVGIYASELLVHAWDLAAATGGTVDPSEGLVAACSAALETEAPTEGRAQMWAELSAQMPPGVPWTDPFAVAPEAPADASALEGLIVQSGRDPRWAPPTP